MEADQLQLRVPAAVAAVDNHWKYSNHDDCRHRDLPFSEREREGQTEGEIEAGAERSRRRAFIRREGSGEARSCSSNSNRPCVRRVCAVTLSHCEGRLLPESSWHALLAISPAIHPST